jgi:hypothetical protein
MCVYMICKTRDAGDFEYFGCVIMQLNGIEMCVYMFCKVRAMILDVALVVSLLGFN